MTEQNKPEDSETPEQVVDEIVEHLDARHRALVNEATRVGYFRDAFKATRPVWAELRSVSTNDPDASVIYTLGVNSLTAYREELRSTEDLFKSSPGPFQAIAGSASSALTIAGTTASFFSRFSPLSPQPNYSVFPPPPDQHELYAGRLSHFDPALGRTYQEIWEALYGTRADPERAALYLMRQAFDHLFGKLAPDDEVRQSPYWTKKTKAPQDQVTREERIQFTAAKHVKDKARSGTLMATATHMLQVYQTLNRAHERGELDQTKARNALTEMQSILEDWADAIAFSG